MDSQITVIVSVVIPCFKVSSSILELIRKIDQNVKYIIIVDDCCPENSGKLVKESIQDDRLIVLFHSSNQGVGGAMKTGYAKALELNSDIIVKLDGDGQMDPSLILDLILPIIMGEADYTKGNRFFSPEFLNQMPRVRLFGNGILSFVNKIVSGYWNIMDPTNGFTAIHSYALRSLPLKKIDNRYFFESDMLFRLNTIRAKVEDIPMPSVYEGEKSSLSIFKTIIQFPFLYLNRLSKRIFYNYYIRDFNIGSLGILLGSLTFGFGLVFGIYHWIHSSMLNIETPLGTIILASTSILIGFQLLLTALNYDISNTPKNVISKNNQYLMKKKLSIRA
jgi:dolichol-phosphate mannosyltransferase